MVKRKKPWPELTKPFTFPVVEAFYISNAMWTLKNYREYRDNVETKIRCRLFYYQDDVPEQHWVLPIPRDVETLYDWVGQLVSETYNGRVGILPINEFTDEDYSVFNEPEESQYGILFEDQNDMLIFKLRLKL